MAIIPTNRNRHKGTSTSNTYKAYTKVSLDYFWTMSRQ